MKKMVICSPSPVRNGWRLHRSTENHQEVLSLPPCTELRFKLSPHRTVVVERLKNYLAPEGGAIYNPALSDWIIEKEFTHPHRQKPKRLLFLWEVEGTVHTYRYIGIIDDYQISKLI